MSNPLRRLSPFLLFAALLLVLPITASAAAKPPRVAKAATDVDPSRLFSADSVWNRPLADDAALDPRSAQLSAGLLAEIRSEISSGIGPWISDTSYSTPIYTVGADQPLVAVKLDTGSWGAPLQAAWSAGVPIPADAVPAAGSDGHMTVYQPSTDTLWEFWKAVKRTDGWHASWGGVMRNASQNPGYYTGSSWPGLTGTNGWNWGSTATSLPVAAGTIRVDELRRGEINHALALVLPNACTGTFAWPAQRTDGTSTASDCVPEGTQLRLDPKLDLTSLNLPPITLMIARAAQRYGMIVRDKTLHATGFFAEDPRQFGVNPYAGATGLYGGLKPWQFLPKLPWASVQVVRSRLCTSAPCLPPA